MLAAACEGTPTNGKQAIGDCTGAWLAAQEQTVSRAPKRTVRDFEIADATIAQLRYAAAQFSARARSAIKDGAEPDRVLRELQGRLERAADDAPHDAALLLAFAPVKAAIRHVTSSRTRGRQAAEDVASDAVVGLLRGYRRGDIISPGAFAATVTRNAAHDAWKRASTQEQAAEASRQEGVRRLRASIDPTPAEALSRAAMQHLLERLESDPGDGAVDARRKLAFLLHVIGADGAEGAHLLEISGGQYRQDVARMRRLLEDDPILDDLLPRKNASKSAAAVRRRKPAVVTPLAPARLPTSRPATTYGDTAPNHCERQRDAA